MRVYTHDGEEPRRALGPADLRGAKAVAIYGRPAESDFGAWAVALGLAALNGAEVRTVS